MLPSNEKKQRLRFLRDLFYENIKYNSVVDFFIEKNTGKSSVTPFFLR